MSSSRSSCALLTLAVMVIFFEEAPGAFAAWTGTVSGNTATLTGGSGDDTITIGVQDFWLKHNRFTAGDPGFASDLDWDSSTPGSQLILNDGGSTVNINGGDGNDTMTINDASPVNGNNVYEVTDAFVLLGIGPAPGGNRPTIWYSNLEGLQLITQSPSNGGVHVLSTRAGTPVTIDGPANEAIHVGDPVNHELSSIGADVTITKGGSIIVDDASYPDLTTYTLAGLKITRLGIAIISINAATDVQIRGGQSDNTWLLKTNRLPQLSAQGGFGTDKFIFEGDDGTLEGFVEPVYVNPGSGGNDIVIFNDKATPAGQSYTFDQHADVQLTRNHALIGDVGLSRHVSLNTGRFDDVVTFVHTFGPFIGDFDINAGATQESDILIYNGSNSEDDILVFGNESKIAFLAENVKFSGFDFLFVNAGDRDDVVTASPSPTTEIHLDGEDPNAGAGDELKLDSGGLPFSIADGTFTVPGYQPIEFVGFEKTSEAPALSVNKTASATGSVGRPLNYSIAVHDIGGDPATSVTLVDTLPSNVTLRSVTGAVSTQQSASILTIDLGNMTSGEVRNVSVVVVPSVVESITNVVSVTANEVQAVTSNTVSSVTTNIGPAVPAPDLAGSFQSAAVFCRAFGSFTRCALSASMNVSNVGDKTAGYSTTRFFLSNDPVLDPSDTSIATRVAPYILVGKTYKQQLFLALPANVDPHGKFLIARIDDQNKVPELFEDNNVAVTGPLQ